MRKKGTVRYLNPLTDFGFKAIFSKEENKELLIDFLNEIIPKKENIINIQYLPTEQLGISDKDRKAIFDIYCTDEKGSRYIIEMQVGKQEFFIDRILFYSTFPIQAQAVKGEWNYELKPLYHIDILDFNIFKDKQCISHLSLIREETSEKVTDKLNIITIELPKFNKKVNELETKNDYWLFSIKNLSMLDERPNEIEGIIFDKLYKTAELKKLTAMERREYNKSILEYADVQSVKACALKDGEEIGLTKGVRKGVQKGLQKGIQKGKLEIAQNLLKMGMSVDYISKATGLTTARIQKI